MSLTAAWINLDIIILSKTEEGKYNITYVGHLKNDTNEFIYKTKAESQVLQTQFMVTKGKGGEGVECKLGGLDLPNQGSDSASPASPALSGGFFITELHLTHRHYYI